MTIFDLTIYILKFFIPALFSVLFRIYGLGYKSKRSVFVGLSIFIAYNAIVPTTLILTIGYGLFTHLSTVVMTLGSMCVLIFSTDKAGKTIFLQLVQSTITTTVTVILNMIRHVFSLSYLTLVIMLLIVCPIVYYFALRFWAKPLRFMADNIHDNIWLHILLPVLNMIIVYIIPVYPSMNYANHPIYCTLLMIAVEFGFFMHIVTFYRNLKKISELSRQELKWKLLQTEMNAYKDFINVTKQNRHDMHHHDTVVLEYLENNDLESAKNYLKSHTDFMEASFLKQFCQNSVANVVLQIYERRAQAAGVSFSAVADIPREVSVSDIELGGMLSNVLENAIFACESCNLPNKYIKFSAVCEDNNLLFEIHNTVGEETNFNDGMPVSKKSGGGTGTQSIEQTVKAHNGIVEYSQKNNEFLTRIILLV